MSSTHENPNPAPDPGPAFNRDQIHNLDQLRLSSDDRYIAGVAGGLARHFRIDPIVVRVVLAALCVFGGIGLMLYAVLWIFVPSDRTNRAIIDLNGPTRRTILLIFGGIAALGAVGSVLGGFGGLGGHFAWPLAAVVAVCAIALAYMRPENYRAHRGPDAPGTAGFSTGGVGAPPAPGSTGEYPTTNMPPSAPVPPPPTWMPPPVPPRPRRTGLVLFWPTVAAILVAFGVLGIIAVDHDIAPLWWPGTALAIVGGALVIGAFVGRPGGLIPLGILMIPPVLATAILGGTDWHHQDVNATPTTAAAVLSNYSMGTGQTTINLSDVTDPAQLAGRTITVTMTAGQIDVTLPSGIPTRVDADLEVAGDVQVAGNDRHGLNPTIHTTVGSGTTTPLHLVLKGRVGSIQVTAN